MKQHRCAVSGIEAGTGWVRRSGLLPASTSVRLVAGSSTLHVSLVVEEDASSGAGSWSWRATATVPSEELEVVVVGLSQRRVPNAGADKPAEEEAAEFCRRININAYMLQRV
jgi:hypothetical protein